MQTFSVEPATLNLLLSLICGHLVGDFVLQSSRMVKEKRRLGMLLLHSGIVAAATYLLVGRWSGWLIPLVIFLSHLLIDWVKVRVGKGGVIAFVVDQIAHLLVIVLLTWAAPLIVDSYWVQHFGPFWNSVLAGVSGFILVVRVGGMLIGFWVQRYLDEIQRAATTADVHFRPTRGLTNGGRAIGQWERALIFLFVALGQYAGVGFLVTAKSIFRFGELKDRENRMEAEYITIGTLMSFGWALAISYATWWLVRWLAQ